MLCHANISLAGVESEVDVSPDLPALESMRHDSRGSAADNGDLSMSQARYDSEWVQGNALRRLKRLQQQRSWTTAPILRSAAAAHVPGNRQCRALRPSGHEDFRNSPRRTQEVKQWAIQRTRSMKRTLQATYQIELMCTTSV
jgi:hypothetical protein